MSPTRKWMLSLLALSAAAVFGFDGSGLDAIRQTSLSGDSLKYLGHASVKIRTSEGKVIYIDPFAGTDYADSADVVLVTHQHGDHNVIGLVRCKATCDTITNVQAVIGGVHQSFSIGGIKVDAVAAYNSNHLITNCVGYVVEFNGIKLYHAGDTELIPEMADLAARNVDYALLPMDGRFCMTPEQAAQAVALIQPKHTIPIHTMPPPDTYDDTIVARFTDPTKLVVRPGETIALAEGNTAVEKSTAQPVMFSLKQNFPNPFNPETVISYSLPERKSVTVKIYNASGQAIRTLFEGVSLAGRTDIIWDSRDDLGRKASSGLYICRVKAGTDVRSMKMILMK